MKDEYLVGQGRGEPSDINRPATLNEARYVIAELADAGSYMISMGHRVEGALDVKRFCRAFENVVSRHDALRTGYEIEEQGVAARVYSAPKFLFDHITATEMGPEAFRDWALPLVFDGVQPNAPETLVRLLVAETPCYWRFTVAMHHSISDGFSRGVVNRELLKIYSGESLPEVGAYADYIGNAPRIPEQEIEEMIGSFPSPAGIPSDGRIQDNADTRGLFVERELRDVGPLLRSVGKAHGASKFGMLAAVYALGLKAFTGEARVSSFFQSEGRKILGAPNSVVGPFSNTLPLNLQFDPEMPFAELAKDISARVQSIVSIETAPVAERILDAGKAPTVSLNMFPPAPRIRAGDLEVGPREFLDRRTEFDLNLVWSEDSGVMRARAFYDSAKISAERVGQFLDLVQRLIESSLKEPEVTCREVLRKAQEVARAKVTADISASPEGRIHDAFFARSESEPDVVAVLSSKRKWTYGELRSRALSYTHALQSAGVESETTVAILAQREPELVAAILGVSAFGAPFIVIDTDYPEARITSILRGAEIENAFITSGASQDFAELDVEILIPVDGEKVEYSVRPEAGRAVAYHLVTSGTTGTPRRISHPDSALLRFIDWQSRTLGKKAFRTMLLAGLSHDPVMRDIFLPLSTGGAIVIPQNDEIRDPRALRHLIQTERPDTLHMTPASGQLVTIGADQITTFTSVGAVFWGGDRLEPVRVSRWRQIAPDARQFNLYGTTETPQAALIHEIGEDEGAVRVPVGKPLPWNGVRLEWDGSPVCYGALGEVVVDLADPVYGARGRPNEDDAEPSTTHYTGDYGFMLPQSGVQLVGRRDNQIKVNSLRVELSEITSQAEQVNGVIQAVTIQTDGENRELAIFAVADPSLKEGKLRAELERVLPRYMVPARIVFLDSMPLTSNGKIDLNELKGRAIPDLSQTGDYSAPQSQQERRLASIFEDILKLSPISVTESFLNLGGDSLTAIRLMMEMERAGLPKTSVQAILQGATIRELAKGDLASSVADEGGPIAPGPLLSRTAIHGLRGLLVVILVVGHWMPGLVARVPALMTPYEFLLPLFKISTPGFAIIFGVSLGYFKYDIFKQQPEVFSRQIRVGTTILVGAMVLLSMISLLTHLLNGTEITRHLFFMSYYNVLGFYLLAVVSTPMWFYAIGRTEQVWWGLAGLIALFICLDLGMRWALLPYHPEGFVQLLRLYATAKFSYFSLGVGALLGVLIGVAIRKQPDLPIRPRFTATGFSLIAIGMAWGYILGDLGSLIGTSTRIEYWKWCLYLGAILSLSALFWWVISARGLGSGGTGIALKLLVSIGVLALPFFIFHGLVLSLKSLTEALGVPDIIGLAMVLSLFFGVGGWAVQRVWRLYFA